VWGARLHVASPFGIPVRVHWSFLALVTGFVLWFGWTNGPYSMWIASVLMLGLAVSVVLHELGHALAARRYGIATDNITLYPIGGVASIERIPEDPDQEIVIALAGPAVNFVLAALSGWVWLLTSSPLAFAFLVSNLGMGLFNLLPAFPMDGGRVLRAVLARRMGWMPASRLAIRIGRVFAWVFILSFPVLGSPTLPLIGVFLLVALHTERERLVQLNWERATGRPPPWVVGAAWYAPPTVMSGGPR
jgi:Zn-dependent protease